MNTTTNKQSNDKNAACDMNAKDSGACATHDPAAANVTKSQEFCSDSKSSQQSMNKSQSSCNSHMGKLVSLSGNILTMTDCDGTHEHSHTLATDAKVFCDGVACRPEDLDAGSTIRVMTRPNDMRVATQIEALAKQAEFAQQA